MNHLTRSFRASLALSLLACLTWGCDSDPTSSAIDGEPVGWIDGGGQGGADGTSPAPDGGPVPDGEAPKRDGAPAADATPPGLSSNTFVLGLGTIAVPISYNNETLDVQKALTKPGWQRKHAALSMAHGYCVFLYLTQLQQRLEAAGATDGEVAAISAGFGPNAFIATVMQESFFRDTAKSGYFQIDEDPKNMFLNAGIVGDAKLTSYYEFLQQVDRAKVVDGNDADRFYTSSVLKGYFDAVSFMLRLDKPTPNGIVLFGLNYARNNANSQPIEIKGVSYPLDASLGLMRLVAYMYNRGPWAQKALELLTNNVNGSQRISAFIPYAEDWGPRYIYQIPAIHTVGQDNALKKGQIYKETISAADIESYLERLSGLYGAAVIGAGKAAAKAQLGQTAPAYNSKELFAALYAVVGAMLESTRP